jgi:hypothetical protein
VLEKRVAVARQPIPVGGVDVGDALDDAVFDDRRLAPPRAQRGVWGYFF